MSSSMSSLLQPLGSTVVFPKESRPTSLTSTMNTRKRLFLYFGASWCGPCKKLHEMLLPYYEEIKRTKSPVEVLYISHDKDEKEFDQYRATHPWPAIPFKEKQLRKSISDLYEVKSFPTLVILDLKHNEIISKDGRAQVFAHNDALIRSWCKL